MFIPTDLINVICKYAGNFIFKELHQMADFIMFYYVLLCFITNFYIVFNY